MCRKRIMHVVESFGGGVYTFLVDLCNAQADKNEVILVYSMREQTPEDFKKDFNSNIKLINLQMVRDINIIHDFRSFIQLYDIIGRNRPDIIHLHSSKAGVLGRLAATLKGYSKNKIFYNPHGYGFLQENISNYRRYFYFYIEKLMALLNGTVIAVSDGEYRETMKFTSRVIKINNAINNREIDQISQINLCENRIKIGTLGRITFQKNPSLFNSIAKQFPQYEFIWIGDGELRSELTASNITIKGWVKRNKAIKLMNEIDIYLQTSLWEGLPLALLEAMYMKKLVLVTDVIGNNDVVKHNNTGFICKDINDFTKYLNNIIDMKESTKKIADNAHSYVVCNHLLDDMLAKYNQAYSNMK